MIRLLAAALMLAALPAHAQRWTPDAGTRAYTIEVVEKIATRADRITRLDFDLATDANGTVAVVKRAELVENGTPKPLGADDACRAALHAGPGEIARITLTPLTGDPIASIAPCASPDLFMPLGEIVRIAMIQLAPQFGIASLKHPGKSYRFGPFASHVDRPAMKLDLESPGGIIRFAKASRFRATVEWLPDPMAATMLVREVAPGISVRGEGIARVALRLTIDRETGALLDVSTIEDSAVLMLDIKDAPPIRIEMTRTVTVRPR